MFVCYVPQFICYLLNEIEHSLSNPFVSSFHTFLVLVQYQPPSIPISLCVLFIISLVDCCVLHVPSSSILLSTLHMFPLFIIQTYYIYEEPPPAAIVWYVILLPQPAVLPVLHHLYLIVV